MKKYPFLIKLISTCFYIGYLPVPGTVGSLAGLGLYFLLRNLKQLPFVNSYSPWMFHLIYSGVVLFVLLVGFLASGQAVLILGNKDDRRIVIDEISGMLIALWGISASTAVLSSPPVISSYVISTFIVAAVVFVLFRVFDILKPYPIKRLETLPGGLGIMADDILAGIYANIAARIILFIFLRAGVGNAYFYFLNSTNFIV